MSITRRQFIQASAGAAAFPPAFAAPPRFTEFLEDLSSRTDNIIFAEPHIGGMFFSAPKFLGQPDGPLTVLGRTGKRHLGLELPNLSPGAYGVIDLQECVEQMAGRRQLISNLLFGRARIQPTFLKADDPAIRHISPEGRMEHFAEGILDTLDRAHESGLKPQLIDYFNPAMARFLADHKDAMGSADPDIKRAANRAFVELRLDDRYQVARLREKIKGPLTGIVAAVGWQHISGIVAAPGIDTLLDGRTTTIALFQDRANEAETLRMTAPFGAPTKASTYTFYLSSGEIVSPRKEVIARFAPFDLLHLAQQPEQNPQAGFALR